MNFDWDVENRSHIRKHDVSDSEAEQVLGGEPFDLDYQNAGGEERFVQVGETNAGRILVIVATWRGDGIRVVTAYDAPRGQRMMYLEARRGTWTRN